MSNFTPKLVDSDKEQPKERTINDLYDDVRHALSVPYFQSVPDEFEDLMRRISHALIKTHAELGSLEDTEARRRLVPHLSEIVYLVSGHTVELPQLDELRDQHTSNMVAAIKDLTSIREAHAEISSLAREGQNSFQNGFNCAKEKLGPLVTPRELLSAEQRHEIWKKSGGRCVYCDDLVAEPDIEQRQRQDGRSLHIDHLVPKSCGGPDHVSNYVPSCESCNRQKNARDPVKFVMTLRNFKALSALSKEDDDIPF